MKKILFISLSLIFALGVFANAQVGDETQNRVRNREMVAPTESGIAEQGEETPVPELYTDDEEDSSDQARLAKGKTNNKGKGEMRRSQVANAVKALLQVGDRQGGIGEQVREIARNQEKNQEQIEASLGEAQKRNRFVKFLIGPKYKQLEKVRTALSTQTQELNQLKGLLDNITGETDKAAIEAQLETLNSVKAEVEAEVRKEMKGMSLLGWLNKIISGYKG